MRYKYLFSWLPVVLTCYLLGWCAEDLSDKSPQIDVCINNKSNENIYYRFYSTESKQDTVLVFFYDETFYLIAKDSSVVDHHTKRTFDRGAFIEILIVKESSVKKKNLLEKEKKYADKVYVMSKEDFEACNYTITYTGE